MQKKLTKLQAYNSMITFVDKYYEDNKSENLSDFLTYAYFWKDGKTADPAAWPEWQEALKKTAFQDKTFSNINRLTSLQACNAMILFFTYYCSLYVTVPSDMAKLLQIFQDIQKNKQKHHLWKTWIHAIDEIINKQDPRVYIQN